MLSRTEYISFKYMDACTCENIEVRKSITRARTRNQDTMRAVSGVVTGCPNGVRL
jgi:hypothetical protein